MRSLKSTTSITVDSELLVFLRKKNISISTKVNELLRDFYNSVQSSDETDEEIKKKTDELVFLKEKEQERKEAEAKKNMIFLKLSIEKQKRFFDDENL